MQSKSLFGQLLCDSYHASGTTDPIERFYATMFGSFFAQTDSQPGSAAVHRIVCGERTAPKKLLGFYRDPDCPRCPGRLAQDLSALIDCCFVGAARQAALEKSLSDYLEILPQADREDLLDHIHDDDLIHLWTRLTWYALFSDHHG